MLLAAGCAAPTRNPAAADSRAGAEPSNTLAVGHVHGLDVDPADGRVYVAGHAGPGCGQASQHWSRIM